MLPFITRLYRRVSPVLKSLSNKVAGLEAGKFLKKRLEHKCFPAILAKFLRTAFL